MTPDPNAPLAAALAEYLAAIEAGTPLDRARFLSDHARLADDLPALLDQLEQVQGVRRVADVAVTQPADPLLLPQMVGEYRLVREIGRGGMGVVYEAEHPALHRRVAVKVVSAPDPASRDRLLHEARVASLLVHPHVVPVHAVGEGPGFAYIVLHYVDGRSLSAVLRAIVRPASPPDEDATLVATGLTNGFGLNDPDGNTPLGYLRRVVRLLAAVTDALGFAHDRDLLHRDVKPGNLLLDVRGHLWLTDFGLARRVSPDVTVGDRVGTPRYMAPELLADTDHRTRVGPEADVYALGATLYELLARRPAFDGDTDADLRANIRGYRLTPLSRLAPHVPTDLATVVHKAMARLPADRYPNASGMADDLRRFLAGRPVTARPLSLPQRAWRWAARRRRSLAVAAAALGCGLAVAAGVGWWGYTKEVQAREELEARESILRELVAEVNKSELVFRHLPHGQAEHRRLVGALKDVVCKWADEPNAKLETKIEAVRACIRLAEVTSNAGLQDESEAATRDSLSRVTALQATDGTNPTVRFLAGETHKMLAGQLYPRGQLAEAKAHGLEADKLFQGLIADDPNRANYRNPLSLLYGILSAIADKEGRQDEARDWLRKGLDQDQWLADRFPTHPLSHIRLAGSWANYGDFLTRQNDPAAEQAYREAKKRDDTLRLTPKFAVQKKDRVFSCSAPLRLASHLLAVSKLDQVGEVLAVAVPDLEALVGEHPDEIAFSQQRSLSHYLLGQWHFLNGRPEAAKGEFRTAIERSHAEPRLIVSYRLKFHHRQPFPELVNAARTTDQLAELSREPARSTTPFCRLQAAVGADDRAAFEAIRNELVRADLERDAALLRAVYLARRGDTAGAKAALPPPALTVDGWDAICRKVVADAK